MWIIVGTRAKTQRIPGGLKLERHCSQCGETTMFYEKEVTDTFRLYFIDVFDVSKQRVMACGACGAHYATDELGGRARVQGESIGGRIERGVTSAGSRVASFIGEAADSFEAGVGSLLGHGPSPRDGESRRASSRGNEHAHHDDPLDDDALVDETEAKFRELERKAGLRK